MHLDQHPEKNRFMQQPIMQSLAGLLANANIDDSD